MRHLSALSAVWFRLRAWHIAPKQGRLHIASPDPEYVEKVTALEQAKRLALEPGRNVSMVYADEMTFYRQPALGKALHEKGSNHQQPTAYWQAGAKTKYRVAGALDVRCGRVVFTMASVMGVDGLCRFIETLRQAYPPDTQLILAWDNWPVHKHPRVLQAAIDNRIELLYLPTYAPWTNPIEKLWKRLKDQVIRLHRYGGKQQWPLMRVRVRAFLQQFDGPCPDLLRYVGLPLTN